MQCNTEESDSLNIDGGGVVVGEVAAVALAAHVGARSVLSFVGGARRRRRRRRRRPPPVYLHLHSTVAVASSLAVTTGCAYSRVYLGYHTMPQVAIGSALGSSLGAAWYALFDTAVVRSSLVRWDGMPAG